MCKQCQGYYRKDSLEIMPHLVLLLSLLSELVEPMDNQACCIAIKYKDGRAPKPRLKLIDGEGDILCVVLFTVVSIMQTPCFVN